MLTLNDRQTEVIHFSTKFSGQGTVPPCDLHVCGVSISHSNALCNLGFNINSHAPCRLMSQNNTNQHRSCTGRYVG